MEIRISLKRTIHTEFKAIDEPSLSFEILLTSFEGLFTPSRKWWRKRKRSNGKKKRSKNKRPTSKEIFTFASAFVRCGEWTLRCTSNFTCIFADVSTSFPCQNYNCFCCVWWNLINFCRWFTFWFKCYWNGHSHWAKNEPEKTLIVLWCLSLLLSL